MHFKFCFIFVLIPAAIILCQLNIANKLDSIILHFASLQQSLYLRDTLDLIVTRKLRETTDFEWRRSIRCYLQPVGEHSLSLTAVSGTSFTATSKRDSCEEHTFELFTMCVIKVFKISLFTPVLESILVLFSPWLYLN